jgi:hypothetical protein
MRHPAYNLKVNKEADRAVMVETVKRTIPLFGNESDYRYFGLGGPFLEDMKRVHSAFPNIKLVSIEGDIQTLERQRYHRFINDDCLELVHASAHNYFRNDYIPGKKDIIWLDYLNFGKQELADFVLLATSVSVGSMLRMTVRGEWKDKLPGAAAAEDDWDKIFRKFRGHFGDLAPRCLEKDDFTEGSRYTKLLMTIIVNAVRSALAPPLPRYFQPLVANYYKDETRMLSLMGVIADSPVPENQQKVGEAFCDSKIVKAFIDWDLASLDGQTVHQLDVPSLSARERMALDRFLPLSGNEERIKKCLNELPYLVGGNHADHRKLVERYAALSPYYAQFARVAY